MRWGASTKPLRLAHSADQSAADALYALLTDVATIDSFLKHLQGKAG